ncbi:MAG: hypothetical protein IT426_18210 [Pirellulales bacterium]|nr:hypothetical protein [Pirellulales bacterium]
MTYHPPAPAHIGPHPPEYMTGRLPNTHRPEALYKRAGRLMVVAARSRGRLSEKKKAKPGGWLESIPAELLLPDVATLEALSRGEPVGPARQGELFEAGESYIERMRRRKREADAQARKDDR